MIKFTHRFYDFLKPFILIKNLGKEVDLHKTILFKILFHLKPKNDSIFHLFRDFHIHSPVFPEQNEDINGH